ncbi:MAG: hypothetical protein P4M11_06970 [Candidatus Pacebacteria bacterium]|nr:hypothetical protein [Candidatus Paceibacterota bacterium]
MKKSVNQSAFNPFGESSTKPLADEVKPNAKPAKKGNNPFGESPADGVEQPEVMKSRTNLKAIANLEDQPILDEEEYDRKLLDGSSKPFSGILV